MKQFLLFSFFLFAGMMATAQKTWDGSSSNNWNTANNWTPSGVPAATDDVIIPNGFNVTVNTAAVCASLTISGGGSDNTISISNGQSLTVGGAVIINAGTGNNDDKFLAVGSGSFTCGSLTMAATGDDSRDVELTLSTGTVTVNGDITMNGTANRNAIRFTSNGNLYVKGSISSGGDIVPSTGTVRYNGNGDQTVKEETYNNIVFSDGGTKTLAGPVTVGGLATFTAGEVITTSTNLLSFTGTATVSGASDASFVSGPVSKTGSANFTFPVGKTGSGYHPIGLANISAPDNFTTEYIRASASSLGGKDQSTPFAVSNISNCEYWNLTKTGSATADVTIGWTASSPCGSGAYVTSIAGLAVSSFNAMTATKWAFAGEATNQPGSVVGGSTPTTGNITKTGVARFTSFALATIPTAGAGNPLPVVFANVKAYTKGTGVQLDWSNMTETDVLNYVVERSSNGVDFTTVASVIAKQNDGGKADYGFYDATPAAVNYYRIQSLEGNNSKKYSVIVKVDMKATKADVVLYPNPVTGNTLSLQATALDKGQYTVRVMSVNGQLLYTKSITHAGGAVTSSVELPSTVKPGMYTLQIAGGTTTINKSFIVR
ncbi:MAG: T9SS type A sorting domain-containing protein [Chitinophagales bacterium]|nr:T9SS type A sorting domain-containing protein [Chitinophagales bacterium]